MSKPYIINITGIQGGGKSYICSKLKDIPCIDTNHILILLSTIELIKIICSLLYYHFLE